MLAHARLRIFACVCVGTMDYSGMKICSVLSGLCGSMRRGVGAQEILLVTCIEALIKEITTN